MRISSEVAIRATIKTGSVLYFAEETLTSSEPHFFIVLNVDPLADEAVVLVCTSSKIRKVKRRCRLLPQETLVTITPTEYSDFKVNSIVDCNTVWQKSISELVRKRSEEKLLLKQGMEASITERIRQGVLTSPTVEHRIKSLLQSSSA